MKRDNRIGIVMRVLGFGLAAGLILLWARSRGGTIADGPVTGFQWAQRQIWAPRPTPRVAPRDQVVPAPEALATTAPPRREPILTEALAGIGAAEYQHQGFRGQGVKVAVIDTQFDGLADAIAVEELPSSTITRHFTRHGRSTPRLRTGRGSHGTACAEIIHDLAPEAQLYLVQTDSFLQSLEDVLAYLHAEGVRIVSISVTVLALGRADGEGVLGEPPVPVYDILRRAHTEQNMLLIMSAGNYARQHYQGLFADANGNGIHEFGPSAMGGSDGESLQIQGRRDVDFDVYLSWDDWGPDPMLPAATADYDLYVLDAQGREVGRSAHSQSGSGPPTEIAHVHPTEDRMYTIRVHRTPDTSEAHALRIWVTGSTLPLQHHQVAAGSLGLPADAESVLTVGAANVFTHRLLSISSQGPTSDGRVKPDVTGPAQVSVSRHEYGPTGFTGTSAAAPHVAGIAALWLSMPDHGNLSAAELKAALSGFAADHGTPGPDAVWGHGWVSLPPLTVTVQIAAPTLTATTTLDAAGRLAAEVSVTRGDGTPLPGLGPGDFQAWLGETPGEVIAVQPVGAGYALHLRWSSTPDSVSGLRAEAFPLTIRALTSSATAAGSVLRPLQPLSTGPAPPRLDLRIPERAYQTGDLIPITVSLDDGAPILNARVTVRVNAPGGATDSFYLVDDGMSGDGVADDGIYGGHARHTHVYGPYGFELLVEGVGRTGPFTRHDATSLGVIPSEFDSDGDGMPDNWETAVGLNPVSNDIYRDVDADGLNNLEEYQAGTDPHNWDTDGDTLSDYAEVTGLYRTSPTNPDTDLGGTDDAAELLAGTNPLDPSDDGGRRFEIQLPPRVRE